MRRFLQVWGRQEPSLLSCPAEAASPPPLPFSAFASSPCANTTLLPITANTTSTATAQLFTNIERQLSAKLTADTLLGGQQPSPPQVSPSSTVSSGEAGSQQQSPAAILQLTPQPTNDVAVASSAPTLLAPCQAANVTTNGLLAAAAVAAAAQQSSVIQQAVPAQKGLDAFFAALANANDSGSAGGTSALSQPPPAPATQSAVEQQLQTGTAFRFGVQPAPPQVNANSLSSLIDGNEAGRQQAAAASSAIAETIQAAANNAIVNAVNAVNFMNAAIAVQQQQQQQNQQVQAVQQAVQQQIQQQVTAAAASMLDTSNGPLSTLKSSLLQPIPTQTTSNNAALNALQIAQSTIQQHQEQQQQQLQLGNQMSPEGIVQAGLPALLNRLSAPNILRPGTSQSKPIPLMEDKVDLAQFKRKEPREWSTDDVVAWILDVARRHQIPCENMNLTKFASCSGPLLMLMNEQSFKEHDPNYGTLLFSEFCKLITDENFIDDLMRSTNVTGPSQQQQNEQPQQQQQMVTNNPVGSLLAANLALQKMAPVAAAAQQHAEQGHAGPSIGQQQPNLLLAAAAGIAAVQQQQQKVGMANLGQLLPPSAVPSAGVSLLALQPAAANQMQHGLQQPIGPLSKMLQQPSPNQQQSLAGSSFQLPRAGTSSATMPGGLRQIRTGNAKTAELKIRRNKDGRPRKRSQHTKGNKLWEFIRDALKDPRTCPSIVRWEDPSEGVFRIVESERLAYLWGQKKNNQKMTYEKLSRAMRTYYEKEILVPVPKSGLYPKKLVYKFGPSAMGWKMAASFAVQSQLAMAVPQHHHHHHHM